MMRPDFTPAIARCVARYYRDENGPLRFCYQGNTYVNNSSYQGKLKETTQIGVELIREPGAYADAELLALAVEALQAAGLQEFQLEVGSAGFFEGIIEQTSLTEEEVLELRTLIEDKYTFGVDAFLTDHQDNIPEACRAILLRLPESFGSMEDLLAIREVQSLLEKNNPMTRSREALERLCELERILTLYGCSEYVTYDLGMLGKLNYYTGIIFRGYTYGTGEAIVSGGRYDHLVGQFGKDAPAVGMAINVDLLLSAISRQKLVVEVATEPVVIRCAGEEAEEGIRRVQQMRREGIAAVLQIRADEGGVDA